MAIQDEDMIRSRGEPGLFPGLLLAALLVGAQFAMVVHAFEHDVGAPQGKVCSTCLTAAQLGAASLDSPVATEIRPLPVAWVTAAVCGWTSRHVLTARQRGPPEPPLFS